RPETRRSQRYNSSPGPSRVRSSMRTWTVPKLDTYIHSLPAPTVGSLGTTKASARPPSPTPPLSRTATQTPATTAMKRGTRLRPRSLEHAHMDGPQVGHIHPLTARTHRRVAGDDESQCPDIEPPPTAEQHRNKNAGQKCDETGKNAQATVRRH